MAKETKQSKEELLKSIEEVLDEALREYEELSKMDDFQYAEDPSRPLDAAPEAEQAQEESAEPAAHEAEEAPAEEAEEEDEKKDKKEDDKEDEKEEEISDEALKSEFEALKSQMESRGLLKSERSKLAKKEDKSNEEVQALKKSFGESIESLSKTVAALNEKIEKIANAPMPRKGVSGLTPLRKSEAEGQSLNKAEVIDKLLTLKKSGKPVETALITRFETNRATEQDLAAIKALIG